MKELDIFNMALFNLQIFLLIFTRISSIFLTAPIIASRNIPYITKIGLAFVITVLLFPIINKEIDLPADILSYLIIILNQVVVGIIIGFTAYMIFIAIQLAGQIIDLQMGFGIVNIIDPLSNMQVSIIGQFQFVLGILIFLVINGHHYLFQAISDSFSIVPLKSIGITQVTVDKLIDIFYGMFIIAFKIAGPATIALLLTNVTLGFIARTVPQMNVFIVGLPLNILVGIAAVLLSLPVIVNMLNSLFNSMWDDIYFIIRSMKV